MKNKTTILILLAVLIAIPIVLLNYDLFFTNTQVNNNNSVDDIVKNIKFKVSQIDAGTDYETITLNNEEFLENMVDGGGQLTGYYKDGELYKIEERLGLSYGIIIYSYYFSKGSLILIHELQEDFPYSEETASFDYSKVEFAFSGYYYIERDNLVDYQASGKKRFDIGKTMQEQVSTLIGYSKENIKLLSEEL